jgi:hypothetical protein
LFCRWIIDCVFPVCCGNLIPHTTKVCNYAQFPPPPKIIRQDLVAILEIVCRLLLAYRRLASVRWWNQAIQNGSRLLRKVTICSIDIGRHGWRALFLDWTSYSPASQLSSGCHIFIVDVKRAFLVFFPLCPKVSLSHETMKRRD